MLHSKRIRSLIFNIINPCLSSSLFIQFLRYFGFFSLIFLASDGRVIVFFFFFISSTYRTANSIRSCCSSPGRDLEGRRVERGEAGWKEEEWDMRGTSGLAGDRSDRVSWKLAKRFVPPRPVRTELVCNSILSATKRREGGWNVDAAGYCVESRESAFAPVQMGTIGFECLT